MNRPTLSGGGKSCIARVINQNRPGLSGGGQGLQQTMLSIQKPPWPSVNAYTTATERLYLDSKAASKGSLLEDPVTSRGRSCNLMVRPTKAAFPDSIVTLPASQTRIHRDRRVYKLCHQAGHTITPWPPAAGSPRRWACTSWMSPWCSAA